MEKLARRKEMTKINIWILRSHHNIQIETDILVEKSRNKKNPRRCALTWPGFLFLGDPVESYVCRQSWSFRFNGADLISFLKLIGLLRLICFLKVQNRGNYWKRVRVAQKQQLSTLNKMMLTTDKLVGSSPFGSWPQRWSLRGGLWSGASSKARDRMTVSHRNCAPLISSSLSSSWATGVNTSFRFLSFRP